LDPAGRRGHPKSDRAEIACVRRGEGPHLAVAETSLELVQGLQPSLCGAQRTGSVATLSAILGQRQPRGGPVQRSRAAAPRGNPASCPGRNRPGTDGARHRRNEHVGCCCLGSTVGREGVRQRHETTQEAD